MKASRKKWLLAGLFASVLGFFGVFLFRAASGPGSTSPPSGPAERVSNMPESPDHELKALAIQLQKKPGHVPVLMRMAALERERGRLKEAAVHLREGLHTEPANPDLHLELGRVLYETGDVRGAIDETEKALTEKPGQVDALYNLGAIYANLGNAGRARTYWMKAVQTDSETDSGRKARESLRKLGGS